MTSSPDALDEAAIEQRAVEFLKSNDPASTPERDFLDAQFDAGLAWVHFPVGEGGLAAAQSHQSIVDRVFSEAGAPACMKTNPIGYGMVAPTILAHGSDEQRERYLRPLFTCEELWCQLFSEPEAGSDVAALHMRAERDGDDWVLNGQKVWTSLGHLARFGMVLARTDPDVAKHRGLTYFVIDMHASGVEVRPLRQMTGGAEFNEVYLTDARVPDSERLSEVGHGWAAAITTLMNERVAIGGGVGSRLPAARDLRTAYENAEESTRQLMRTEVLHLLADAEVVRLTTMRAQQRIARGIPGPEGSVSKQAATSLTMRIRSMAVDLLGPAGMLSTPYDADEPDLLGDPDADPAKVFLRSRAHSIEGGTSEIMKNILAERMLGLPAEPKADKGLTWREAQARQVAAAPPPG